MTRIHLALVTTALIAPLSAMTAAQQASAPAAGAISSRSTVAVTYEARRTTQVDLVGTPLMPRARGEAEIETESSGPVRIKARVKDVTPPAPLGPEYLTYVLWAVPPQGRAKNLGELRLDDGAAEIEATADAQTFALIITAEPYYAVTTPSDVVVIENAIRQETRGRTSVATLNYEIVPRGAYVAGEARYTTPRTDKKEPRDVQQARNAVAIAQIAQAARYAPDGLATAQRLLAQVEQLVAGDKSTRDIQSQARAAVQAAEEARLQSVGRRLAEAQEAARAAAAAREQAARTAAAQELAAREAAVRDRERAEAAARDAVREREQAQQAALDAARQQERAEQARREAEALRAQAQAQAGEAQALRAQAETEKAALRAKLLQQFSAILDTQDTARGLIVNVGDVLFETGKYELLPPAREKLARFAGIVLGHPDLAVQAEGFTDSTGTAEINEQLSQRRADAVSDFLKAQGLPRERLATRGFGATQPVASNDTPEGRRQNRRVELVVSGEVIGTPIGLPRP
jgi:outer membrane protein OmpA-like peptidoglycan-associated protein